MTGDRAGFSPQPQDGDLCVVHNEGMFLLIRRQSTIDGKQTKS
jgi:hypothetical protein